LFWRIAQFDEAGFYRPADEAGFYRQGQYAIFIALRGELSFKHGKKCLKVFQTIQNEEK
jgi:hypothetical protein